MTEANRELALLQSRLAPRRLTTRQKGILQSLKGHIAVLNIACEMQFEPWSFATNIAWALHEAGIKTAIYARRSSVPMAGVYLYDRNAFGPDFINSGMRKIGDGVLVETLKSAGVFPEGAASVGCVFPDGLEDSADKDVPIIVIGEKGPAARPPPDSFDPGMTVAISAESSARE